MKVKLLWLVSLALIATLSACGGKLTPTIKPTTAPTAIPTVVATPTPWPNTEFDALLSEASNLCSASFAVEPESTSLSGKVLILHSLPDDSASWHFYTAALKDDVPVADSMSEVTTLVCVRASCAEYGMCIPGGASYTPVWDVRLVDFEGEQVTGSAHFAGPPQCGCPSFTNASPSLQAAFSRWLAIVSGQEVLPVLSSGTGGITSIAFSPDGKLLASGTKAESILLWDVKTWRTIATLSGNREVTSIAFSPEGQFLAAGFGGEIKVWDVTTRQELVTLSTHSDDADKGFLENPIVAFSPDGRILAASVDYYEDTIRLWAVGTWEEIATFTENAGVYSIAFASDGKLLASGNWDGTIQLWTIPTWEKAATIEAGRTVQSLSFSPDGKLLASGVTVGRYGQIRLWDVSTKQEIKIFKSEKGSVDHVAFSSNGELLAFSEGSYAIRVWDHITGQSAATLYGPIRVTDVAFSPDATILAAGSDDGTIWLWNLQR
jgi:WD40 repeat protein